MRPLKIFISHSRDEEWLARMIAAELDDIGADPRTYERNTTGTPVDEWVRAELEGCDQFLVLLTPTSIWSHWVLYELSIALYLRKEIRPFFMYIREQDIPPAARNYLRRPIGEIPLYFDELRKYILKTFAAEAASELAPEERPPDTPDPVLQFTTDNPKQIKADARRIILTAPSPPSAPLPEPELPLPPLKPE